jgi:hypothetical protein
MINAGLDSPKLILGKKDFYSLNEVKDRCLILYYDTLPKALSHITQPSSCEDNSLNFSMGKENSFDFHGEEC